MNLLPPIACASFPSRAGAAAFFVVVPRVGWVYGIAILAMLAATSAMAQQNSGAEYTAPRTPFGHPDLQGIWQVLNTAVWDIEDHSGRLGMPAGQGVVVGGDIPYQPWAAEQRAARILRIA